MTNTTKTTMDKMAMNVRMFLGAIAVLFLTVSAEARVLPEILELYEGESRVIDVPNAARISVGKTGLVGYTLLKSGEVVLSATAVGETNMQVWFADGSREEVDISVIQVFSSAREMGEIRRLIGDIPGVEIKSAGRHVVVDGILEARDMQKVEVVAGLYEDLIVLARTTDEFE